MTFELPAQALIAVGTVIAALVAGLIAFVSLTLTKEQKTSEFRQAWIDGLREDLAAFLSASRASARTIESRSDPSERAKAVAFEFTDEKVSELRHETGLSYYKIKLRLNPEEAEHIELLRLLDRTVEEQSKFYASDGAEGDPFAALERVAEFARPVLKSEWNRVKAGELPFRVVRNWLAPAIVVLCLAFIALLVGGKFEA